MCTLHAAAWLGLTNELGDYCVGVLCYIHLHSALYICFNFSSTQTGFVIEIGPVAATEERGNRVVNDVSNKAKGQ